MWKKLWEKFIKNLAAANQQQFGNQKLDCCDLNRNQMKNPNSR